MPTYWDYLKLEDLLQLQNGLDADESDVSEDELHFIIVHQVYELWFKLVLRSLRLARDRMNADYVSPKAMPEVLHHIQRATTILRAAVGHFDVVESLTPQGFLDFRDKLMPASGFQSFQMRELEILLGLEDSQRFSYGKKSTFDHIRGLAEDSPGGRMAVAHLDRARNETTLFAAFAQWFQRTPIHGSVPSDAGDDQVVRAFIEDYLASLGSLLKEQAATHTQIHGDAADIDRFDRMHQSAREFLEATDVDESERHTRSRARCGVLFIECYRELPLLAMPRQLIDAVVELEEQVVIFRSRHARMVERVIGRRVGTGGSNGVDYLDKTTQYRVFHDLWSVRTILMPKRDLPPLRNEAFYGFPNQT